MTLPGAVHKITIQSLTGSEVDDGAGGFTTTAVAVYTDISCRITVLDRPEQNNDELIPAGFEGLELWKVFCEPAPLVQRNYIVVVGSSSGSLLPAGNYRILKIKHQQDDLGNHHHTSFSMEAQ